MLKQEAVKILGKIMGQDQLVTTILGGGTYRPAKHCFSDDIQFVYVVLYKLYC